MKQLILIAAMLSTLCSTGVAQLQSYAPTENLTKAQNWSDRSSGQINFTENKGQITQTDGQSAPYVKFMLQRGSTNIYLLADGGIAYQFNQVLYPEGYKELMSARNAGPEQIELIQQMQKDVRVETFRMDMHLEELERALEKFVEKYNYERYHESLQNLTPADVYFGRGDQILAERKRIKDEALKQRRMAYDHFKMRTNRKIT